MTCDRVTIINRGKVVATNTPIKLQQQLASSSGYEIEIEGDLQNIISLIQEIPGIASVEINSHKSFPKANRTLLQITCADDAEPGDKIAATIVNQGLGLQEMRRIRPSLEDVFLELTTEELAISGDEENTDEQ
jgi:ABC-2 type transport system ATP-binding protein